MVTSIQVLISARKPAWECAAAAGGGRTQQDSTGKSRSAWPQAERWLPLVQKVSTGGNQGGSGPGPEGSTPCVSCPTPFTNCQLRGHCGRCVGTGGTISISPALRPWQLRKAKCLGHRGPAGARRTSSLSRCCSCHGAAVHNFYFRRSVPSISNAALLQQKRVPCAPPVGALAWPALATEDSGRRGRAAGSGQHLQRDLVLMGWRTRLYLFIFNFQNQTLCPVGCPHSHLHFGLSAPDVPMETVTTLITPL